MSRVSGSSASAEAGFPASMHLLVVSSHVHWFVFVSHLQAELFKWKSSLFGSTKHGSVSIFPSPGAPPAIRQYAA